METKSEVGSSACLHRGSCAVLLWLEKKVFSFFSWQQQRKKKNVY
jgi:hypothetical protein